MVNLTLERFIPPTSKVQFLKKLIVDQTICGPFIMFFFYTLSGTLAGKEFQEIKLLLRERYVKTIFTAYKVWRFVQAVNFSLVLFSTGLILFSWCPCVGRYVKTIFTAYKVWPFVQAVNFSLVLFSTGLILFSWCPYVGICTCLECQTNL